MSVYYPPSTHTRKKNLFLLWIILFFLTLPVYASEFKNCLNHFPKHTIPVQKKTQTSTFPLCYERFAILYSGQTKTPIYVVERLNRELLEYRGIKRKDNFFADSRLPSHVRAQLSDYKYSGYSRGHMAAAGNMTTETSMAQSFSLANIVPQNSQHNSQQWAKVEADTRKYIRRINGDVYVFTGPVYTHKKIIGNGVYVPQYLFKLVYDPERQQAWAYWSENTKNGTIQPLISYQDLVKKTGIEFLPGVKLKSVY